MSKRRSERGGKKERRGGRTRKDADACHSGLVNKERNEQRSHETYSTDRLLKLLSVVCFDLPSLLFYMYKYCW
jgi:hypothetical protein